MITKLQSIAIVELYPQIVVIRGDVAYDANGTEVSYDINAVNAKVLQNAADATVIEQAQANAKQSALNKLMALGLTEEEALALGVK
jgi:hypothetical protein